MEIATCLGMLLGIGMLIACLVVEDHGFLAIPGFLLVLPSLIAGTR
jgi:hypothetical protein